MTRTRIVNSPLLCGFFVVTGPHNTPISGRFDTRAAAQTWLDTRRDAVSRRDRARERMMRQFNVAR